MPKEMRDFMITLDYANMPVPDDAVAFGKSWRLWFNPKNPDWRIVEGEAKLRDHLSLVEGERWVHLNKAGPRGIIIAIVGVVMWYMAGKRGKLTRKETGEIMDAAKDVHLTIQMMTVMLENDKGGRKRTAEEAGPSSASIADAPLKKRGRKAAGKKARD